MTFRHDGMRFVAVMGLLYLGWSWVRLARDFSAGVARVDWQWTTALFRGQRDATVYQRSNNGRAFWWCTASQMVIYSILTLGFLMLLLET